MVQCLYCYVWTRQFNPDGSCPNCGTAHPLFSPEKKFLISLINIIINIGCLFITIWALTVGPSVYPIVRGPCVVLYILTTLTNTYIERYLLAVFNLSAACALLFLLP